MLYFFSAIFQGFAALLTLGVMFYLYYMNKVNENIMWIESELRRQFNASKDLINKIELITFVEYCRKEYVSKLGEAKASEWDLFIKTKVDEYDKINKKKEKIRKKIPIILYMTISILIVSMISLLGIGYLKGESNILFGIGIFTVIISIIDLIIIINLIKSILKDK